MIIRKINRGVYLITNTTTGAVYVGSAAKSFDERWYNHRLQLRSNIHDNLYLQRAWNKYGEASFVFSVAEYVENPDEVLTREQHWIDRYFGLGKGHCYNLSPTAGSCRGCKARPETIEKRVAKLRGQKRSEEFCRRMSEMGKGRIPTLEARQKQAAAQRGRKRPRSVGDKNSKSYTGFIAPDGTEHRNILNLNQFCKERGLDSSGMYKLDKGEIYYLKGWRKIDTGWRNSYGFIAPDGTHYTGIALLGVFCREHKLNATAMSMVYRGIRAHHRGWRKLE
jgi:group I intron endonuclease